MFVLFVHNNNMKYVPAFISLVSAKENVIFFLAGRLIISLWLGDEG